jgi:hypothetical protein
MFDHLPKKVTIRDMGPREGMQSEANVVPTEKKLELIRALLKAGFKHIQVTSFVSPKVVKQFEDAEELLKKLEHPEGVFYWATCPNMRAITLEDVRDSLVKGQFKIEIPADIIRRAKGSGNSGPATVSGVHGTQPRGSRGQSPQSGGPAVRPFLGPMIVVK